MGKKGKESPGIQLGEQEDCKLLTMLISPVVMRSWTGVQTRPMAASLLTTQKLHLHSLPAEAPHSREPDKSSRPLCPFKTF